CLPDGTPDPVCSAKPTPCAATMCMTHEYCAVPMKNRCDTEYDICTIPKENWKDAFDPPLDPSLYPGLTAGADYNQPYQILHQVDDIIALQDFYRVGEIRVHTGFLFDPAAASDPLAAPFNLDHDPGVAILSAIAMPRMGTL